jgi:hypothetical protein|tara:strand:- start:100 stop:783 length:684 start_codon:yes stop_codon:yes gene_type:complete
MAGIGEVGGMLLGWLLNPLIWLLIIGLVFGATFGILLIRKKRKLIYECIELVDYGSSKFGFNSIKCGYFGKKKILRGLWDSGEEQLETKDGEVIYDFSTEDFQEVNGKRGVIAFRDPINQNILVPISKTTVKNKELLAEIAPAEFRDVALDIIRDADVETKDWKEKIIQFVMWGIVVIFSLVSIIVIAQMVKNGQTEASKLILEAGKTCLENAREVCSEIAASSGAP